MFKMDLFQLDECPRASLLCLLGLERGKGESLGMRFLIVEELKQQ